MTIVTINANIHKKKACQPISFNNFIYFHTILQVTIQPILGYCNFEVCLTTTEYTSTFFCLTLCCRSDAEYFITIFLSGGWNQIQYFRWNQHIGHLWNSSVIVICSAMWTAVKNVHSVPEGASCRVDTTTTIDSLYSTDIHYYSNYDYCQSPPLNYLIKIHGHQDQLLGAKIFLTN